MKKTITVIVLLFCCSLLSAQDKNTDQRNEYFLYAGMAIVALVAGFLVYRFFKTTQEKKSDLVTVIKKVFPNPSHGPITIYVEGKASQLKIFNGDGNPLGAFAVTGGEMHFDFSSMPRGNYTVIAYYGATASNAVQFVLQ
jgi:ABC-type nickel/cobalt efflux system permease component RcnA